MGELTPISNRISFSGTLPLKPAVLRYMTVQTRLLILSCDKLPVSAGRTLNKDILSAGTVPGRKHELQKFRI